VYVISGIINIMYEGVQCVRTANKGGGDGEKEGGKKGKIECTNGKPAEYKYGKNLRYKCNSEIRTLDQRVAVSDAQ